MIYAFPLLIPGWEILRGRDAVESYGTHAVAVSLLWSRVSDWKVTGPRNTTVLLRLSVTRDRPDCCVHVPELPSSLGLSVLFLGEVLVSFGRVTDTARREPQLYSGTRIPGSNRAYLRAANLRTIRRSANASRRRSRSRGGPTAAPRYSAVQVQYICRTMSAAIGGPGQSSAPHLSLTA